MRKLLCGAALAALAVSGAVAQTERGERGQGAAAAAEHTGQAARAPERGGPERGGPERGDNGPERSAEQARAAAPRPEPDRPAADRPDSDRREAERSGANGRGRDDAGPAQPGRAQPGQDGRFEPGELRVDLDRGPGEAAQREGEAADRRADAMREQSERQRDTRRVAAERPRERRPSRVIDRGAWDNYRVVRYNRGPIAGCPPGLRERAGGCLPPGQAKQLYERRKTHYRPAYFGYGDRAEGRYLYDDGYLFSLDEGWDVASYIPLLGGALSLGNPWPDYYEPAPLPNYYVDYYNLGPASGYRYADDVIYRVNPQSSSITSIAALLTGDEFAIGQPMPEGYDIYNVPYPYRDRYYDTPEAEYRYADGYIYRSDPASGLIQAAIELLV